jgi:hypothetical protein
MRTILALVAVAPFVAVAACGGSEPPAASPSSPPPPPTASVASPAPSGSAPSLASIVTTDGTQVAAIASAAASAPPPSGAASKDLETGLAAVAAKSAPGMTAEGPIASDQLKEGGHLAWTVTMKPGKCYAIVGYSPKGEIVDLDLHLLAPPLYMMLSGEDETDDNTPVVGKAPNPMCPMLDVGMPYKVDLHAQKGAGKAAVQLFSKNK